MRDVAVSQLFIRFFFRHISVGPITLLTSCHINVLITHGLEQEFIHY